MLKSQLYAITNVPVQTMKLMVKGKMVKDADDLTKLGLTNGMQIMMMGTAEDKGLKEPTQQIKFFEDMTAEEKARAMNQTLAVIVPPGLTNLGNTCYMASTFQVLKRVNELKQALSSMNAASVQAGDSDARLAFTAGRLMAEMDKPQSEIAPYQFLQSLQASYPMFAEKDDHGHPKQQDADECF